MSGTHPVEEFLDELTAAARHLPPREARHLVTEAEAHLYDTTADLMRAGVPEREAQLQAVARYGDAATLVRAEQVRSPLSLLALARRVLVSGVRLGAIGAILIGLSGVVAGAIRLVFGSHALIDVGRGTVLSAADCARWLGQQPHATSCRAAAVDDWTAETIWYRIALGVVGLLVWFAVRSAVRRFGLRELDPGTADAVALTLLVVGVAATFVAGVGAIRSGAGGGQFLSGTAVAALAAAWYGVRVSRRLRHAPIPGESQG